MYKPTIGLEIHAELKTKTKMFCGCANPSASSGQVSSASSGQVENQPNVNVCPVCLAHPGTLPTANKKAIEFVLKLGLALGGEISKISKFDRKNYFYPDLPKGYQISQYDQPFVLGGKLNGIKITRIHLEEDTARLLHANSDSLVDFNRAGVPLMELVTEPDIKSSKEAVNFAKEFQLILRYLDVSDADMEHGQMRVEANVSISKNREFGVKVEVKNLNSFRAVEEAIDYEIKRQEEVLEKGGKVVQETRGWDENKKITVSQRLKEESHDYRYFPEPDLPPFDLTDKNFIDIDKLKSEIPELPGEKRERLKREFGLNSEQAEIFTEDRELARYFEESVSEFDTELRGLNTELRGQSIQLIYNYLASDIKGYLNEKGINIDKLNITPENFADLIVLIIKGEISSRVAKDLIKEMALTGVDPRQIISEKGLSQISDEGEIKKIIEEIILKNPTAVADYKGGKQNVLQFLIGQVMKILKGRANPELLKKLFAESLSR
ncbi:Asp-tRNA(Asn)/Glu-tRNA(Gln) amidotransferase subunit GatB [Candidatus Wolfebacteria bacterium]|nr:Asp-tRNA(Asn)/Glu-tRNA(Gln) amidotransferase subunit GatB [Candidatus Wolfebacteria bacterium]